MDKRLLLWDVGQRIEIRLSQAKDHGDEGVENSGHYIKQLTKAGLVRDNVINLDGNIVSFNPLCTVSLGCNTAFYITGSLEQAKSALFTWV